jgi:hypothetical protein
MAEDSRAIDLVKGAHRQKAFAGNYRIPEVGSIPMMDVIVLAIGFVFFAVSIAYVYACDLL